MITTTALIATVITADSTDSEISALATEVLVRARFARAAAMTERADAERELADRERAARERAAREYAAA